jgi:(p)ppGpp synthase/HD superfamily hydrolase
MPPGNGTDGRVGGAPLYSPLLEAAIRLAARGHHHQFRKSPDEPSRPTSDRRVLPDRVPYVAHLMATVCILARIGASDDVLAAAALHDYLEDVPDPEGRKNIRRAVGDQVLALVEAVTEDKREGHDSTATWKIRKREQLEHLAHMPEQAVLIKAADVIHNIQSLVADLELTRDVDSIWEPFNAGPAGQLWYFESVSTGVADRLGPHPLVTELERSLGRLRSYLT